MRRLPFPKAYIVLTIGRRGRFIKGRLIRGRLIRGRLKSVNSVTIKLIIKVVYIAIRILIGISIRVSIGG